MPLLVKCAFVPDQGGGGVYLVDELLDDEAACAAVAEVAAARAEWRRAQDAPAPRLTRGEVRRVLARRLLGLE